MLTKKSILHLFFERLLVLKCTKKKSFSVSFSDNYMTWKKKNILHIHLSFYKNLKREVEFEITDRKKGSIEAQQLTQTHLEEEGLPVHVKSTYSLLLKINVV